MQKSQRRGWPQPGSHGQQLKRRAIYIRCRCCPASLLSERSSSAENQGKLRSCWTNSSSRVWVKMGDRMSHCAWAGRRAAHATWVFLGWVSIEQLPPRKHTWDLGNGQIQSTQDLKDSAAKNVKVQMSSRGCDHPGVHEEIDESAVKCSTHM